MDLVTFILFAEPSRHRPQPYAVISVFSAYPPVLSVLGKLPTGTLVNNRRLACSFA